MPLLALILAIGSFGFRTVLPSSRTKTRWHEGTSLGRLRSDFVRTCSTELIMSRNSSPAKGKHSDALENQSVQIASARLAVQDCLFLSLVVVLSLILYVQGLGFYSDDWAFVGILSNATDQSLFGLVQGLFPETPGRPVQSYYLATLYWLFGPHPVGYHWINGAVFAAAILLFYAALRELGLPRVLTLSVPLVYALLPHYSTDRFWFATFQANLSMGLYLLSLYSDLRAVRAQRIRQWGWKLLSILALVGSVLAYEVFIPLFLVNLLLVRDRAFQLQERIFGKRSPQENLLPLLLASNLLALIAATGYKILATDRIGVHGDYFSHIAGLVKGAIAVNYYSYGLGLPLTVGRILSSYPDVMILAGGSLLGLVVLVYLYGTIGRDFECISRKTWLQLIVMGLVVFGLGYAVFLTTDQVGFTTTGVNNRTAIAAAAGVGMSFVGVTGLMSSLPSVRIGKGIFCLLVALLCICGFLINNTIATFWVAAFRQQQIVITAVRNQFPTLPPHSRLILDGVCPYIGPGIVFECYWDVGGMLRTHYRDPTLEGDIVRHGLEVKGDGLYTKIYGETRHYPYNDNLLLYHFGRKKIYWLTDFETVRRYFQTVKPDQNSSCPRGDEGYGVRIF